MSVLDVHGYAAVPAGSVTKKVPMAAGVQSAVPVLSRQADSSDELVTRVVSLEFVPAQPLIEALRALLPEAASFSAEPSSNAIVVTDRADNIDRVVAIIRRLVRSH